VTLPAGSNFSIEGKQGTTSGFDGAGISGPLLGTAGSEEAGALTLSDLTFRHADLTGASALSIRAARVTLSGDSLLENEAHGPTAGAVFVYVGANPSSCPAAAGPPAITLTGSTFSHNKLVVPGGEGGGGAAWIRDKCAQSRNVLAGNMFEGNVLEAAVSTEGQQVVGAGLDFVGGETQPASVNQSGNVFDANRILASPPALGNYGGGGEWLEDASLLSVGDRFSRNTIAGTIAPASSAEFAWSWGAGLGVRTPACNKAALPPSTLEDAVVAGNAIEAGTTADLGGGGIWVGCSHLSVLDSTVTLNTAPVGAGIEGEPFDQLELVNSIVAEDSPGGETEGFNEAGGSVTATFSDICGAASSSQTLPGAGNICANPLLADNGNPASFDVHETELSPTIDSGSNALVPTGLATDFYGTQRILSGRSHTPACVPPEVVWPTLDPPVVDMGASEYGPIAVPAVACVVTVASGTPAAVNSTAPVSSPTAPAPSSKYSMFSFPPFAQRPSGVLIFTLKGLVTGQLRVNATFTVIHSVVLVSKGRRRRVSKAETVTYGHATRAVGAAGDVTLQLEPTHQALMALERRKRLQVRISIIFTAADATLSAHSRTLTVVYRGMLAMQRASPSWSWRTMRAPLSRRLRHMSRAREPLALRR
jgi:hypothetical protein